MITAFPNITPTLPYLLDDDLRKFWAYQVDRLQRAAKYGWLVCMVPVATELKLLAEKEMIERGMNWNIKAK